MLSPNQIRANARQFSLEWKDETRERAESQTFWNEFFAVFGVNRRKVGIFEAALFQRYLPKEDCIYQLGFYLRPL